MEAGIDIRSQKTSFDVIKVAADQMKVRKNNIMIFIYRIKIDIILILLDVKFIFPRCLNKF